MLWLDCPRCGRRPLDEFTFGGERRAVPGLDHRPRRARLRRGLDLREPRRRDDRALVPRLRLPALADGPARHLDRHRRWRSRMTAARRSPLEIVLRNRVLVRGRGDRAAPRGGRRGRWLARLRRDRPGRPRARASSTASSASSRPAGSTTGVFAEVEPNPGASTVERGAAALRDFGLDGTVVVAGRRRLVDGHGQGARPPRHATTCRSGSSTTTARTSRPAGPSSPSRRPPGPAPRPTRFGVITDEAAGRKDYIGHPSLLPGGDDPRPGADRRAAAGRDRRDRHRRDDPLARIAAVGEPEPVRRGDGARRHPDGRGVAARGPSPTARTSRRARRC